MTTFAPNLLPPTKIKLRVGRRRKYRARKTPMSRGCCARSVIDNSEAAQLMPVEVVRGVSKKNSSSSLGRTTVILV